jgi:transcriptional regulator with GAF, ATPase, and Fis domain
MPISSKAPRVEKVDRRKTVGPSRSKTVTIASSTEATADIHDSDLHIGRDLGRSALFTADLYGKITGCNQGFKQYGFDPEDLVGRSIGVFFGVGREGFPARRAIVEVLDKGQFTGELNCRLKSGEDVTVQLSLTILRDSSGAPAGILGLSANTTANVSATPVATSDSSTLQSLSGQTANAKAATPLPLARREIDGTQFLIASPIMHKFMGMVDRVAGHTETVLVTGETGTGKELVARTIHESSHRHGNTLVDINCAALPEHLVESELFGYEKGAFSGADSSKPGLFELADKSTIFLDEIGELQPQIQVKLLRVLDGQPYYRLGGNRKITVDVRVVAATNQDLELAVKEGRFRTDLFHRLCQFQLRVPPLRERPEDIAALARHFLSLKAAGKSFAADALAVLQAHSWPGNIRELRNLVAKLAMATDDPQITSAEVRGELCVERAMGASASASGAVPLGNLDNMEEQMIIRALEQSGGHRAQAADQLGISRRTLSRKLREYEIDTRTGEGAARLGVISEDQQKFFRAEVNISVTLKNAQGKELQIQAVNLSTGGMGLDSVSDANGFAGLVDVSFLLPDSETEIRAKGRVVWAEAGGRAGLRFVVIDPALFEHLQHWTNRKMKDEGWETPRKCFEV